MSRAKHHPTVNLNEENIFGPIDPPYQRPDPEISSMLGQGGLWFMRWGEGWDFITERKMLLKHHISTPTFSNTNLNPNIQCSCCFFVFVKKKSVPDPSVFPPGRLRPQSKLCRKHEADEHDHGVEHREALAGGISTRRERRDPLRPPRRTVPAGPEAVALQARRNYKPSCAHDRCTAIYICIYLSLYIYDKVVR